MYNLDVKTAIRQAGFFGYEVAAALGISETCFSRQLSRAELSSEKKEKIMGIILKMVEKRAEKGGV
ncbi:MAG: hypothetical protein K6F56_01630 [Oscillospiraceae bacterium]|nr:hypothetical protein [Oscillospiraceae bacterium]